MVGSIRGHRVESEKWDIRETSTMALTDSIVDGHCDKESRSCPVLMDEAISEEYLYEYLTK
jgi:hypothetical protein